MSSLRFPAIQTKKTLFEEEDYNFVNKGQKKKTSSGNPLELIEQLKRKIEQQKKQIDNRNITIQGLQRNFQSLSVIVKTEKTQSAMLRAELQNLRQNSQTGDKRAMQFHQKFILLQKQGKLLKDQLKQLKKAHSQCGQWVVSNEQLRKKISQLQQTNERMHNRLMQSDSDKKILENQLTKYKVLEKEKRLLNQRVIDLEDQIKRLTDLNNSLEYKHTLAEEEVARYKNEVAARQKKIDQFKMRYKDIEKQKERLQFEIDYLKKQNNKLNGHIQQKLKLVQNTQLYSRLKAQEQQRLNRQNKSLLQLYHDVKTKYEQSERQVEERGQMLNVAQEQIDSLRKYRDQLKEQFQDKQSDYQFEIQKLTNSIRDLHEQLNQTTGQFSDLKDKLHQQRQKNETYNYKVSSLHSSIDDMNRQMQEHQQRYGHYFKLIAQNQPDVIITNEREMSKMQDSSSASLVKYSKQVEQQTKYIAELQTTITSQSNNVDSMRRYIKSLEEEISHKSQQLLEKTRIIRKYQDQETQLNNMINSEKKSAERLKRQAEEKIIERMKQLQNQKLRSRKQIEEEKGRLEELLRQERQRNTQQLRNQQQKLQNNARMLEQYQREEQKLRQMMAREKEELAKLSSSKEQEIERLIKEKQQDLEREKKNNKLLWSDNKKLKDLENKLREDSTKLLEQKETAKREEVERLKRELQKKYKQEVRGQETNSYELKRILQEKSNQFKILSQDFAKLKTEAQFYKNRNKELQSLVSRLERQLKDKTTDLQRENKSNKAVIQTLDRKLKEFENNQTQLQRKQKKELKLLYSQIEQMKIKAKNNRVEEKVALVNKSMEDLDTSLKTLMNTMSCNYCVEVVKECVRLQCGHIYCKKCKAGYEPNCGQCKKKSVASNDKIIDESVTKAQYMRILINTIKDDLIKISQ